MSRYEFTRARCSGVARERETTMLMMIFTLILFAPRMSSHSPSDTASKKRGGAQISEDVRGVIIHMSKRCRMQPRDIAPLIPNPRMDGSAICERSVWRVLTRDRVYGSVGAIPQRPRARKMAEGDARSMLVIVKARPFLYVDEIARELAVRCGTLYKASLCYAELRRRGYSLKVLRRKAAQRNEYKRYQYWGTIGEIMDHSWQLCFADEVGQDERGSRRRRGWAPEGEPSEMTELLHRGKHISALALYGFAGFIDFDWVEGGFSAEDFLHAVEFTIVPHLQRYDPANPRPNSIFVLVCVFCAVHCFSARPDCWIIPLPGQLRNSQDVRGRAALLGGGSCGSEAGLSCAVRPH